MGVFRKQSTTSILERSIVFFFLLSLSVFYFGWKAIPTVLSFENLPHANITAKIEECHANGIRTQSQFRQDSIVLEILKWPNVSIAPIYVDVGANKPIHISNTYFFDRCFGWKGICVEPSSSYHVPLLENRTCHLVPTCISKERETTEFIEGGVLGGIVGSNKNVNGTAEWLAGFQAKVESGELPVVQRTCVSVNFLLTKYSMFHIGVLSMDIEGHEMAAFESIDWARTLVDIILLEINDFETPKFLMQKGFVRYEGEVFIHSSLLAQG